MHQRLKTLLVWLLLLAVPLQVFAASMQLSCAPLYHEAVQMATAHEHHLAGGAHAGHQHDMSHRTMADGANASGLQTADTSSVPADPSDTCSACAACYIGAAAIPSKVRLAPDFGPATKIAATDPSSFTGHIPAGPERPPRHLLC